MERSSSQVEAVRFAHLMGYNFAARTDVSLPTIAVLKRRGLDAVGKVRDAFMGGKEVKGFGVARRVEITAALEKLGAWPAEHPGVNSYGLVALKAHELGYAEGKALAEKEFLTQTVEFNMGDNVSVPKLKDVLLRGYRGKDTFIAIKIVITYKVPGIGEMICEGKLIMHIDGLNKLVCNWNPSDPKDVSGDCVVQFVDGQPRSCDFTINFDNGSGTMVMQPPDASALERYKAAASAK